MLRRWVGVNSLVYGADSRAALSAGRLSGSTGSVPLTGGSALGSGIGSFAGTEETGALPDCGTGVPAPLRSKCSGAEPAV